MPCCALDLLLRLELSHSPALTVPVSLNLRRFSRELLWVLVGFHIGDSRLISLTQIEITRYFRLIPQRLAEQWFVGMTLTIDALWKHHRAGGCRVPLGGVFSKVAFANLRSRRPRHRPCLAPPALLPRNERVLSRERSLLLASSRE